MSALNFVIQENIVVIATDTLALSAETNRPLCFQTKFYPIPHLDGIICGTGVSQLVAQWALQVQTSMLVKNIPDLDRFASEQLRELRLRLEIPKEFTSKIFHFGYDLEINRFRGFLYNSEKNFESEEFENKFFWTQPYVSEFPEGSDVYETLKNIVSIQREQELSQPPEKRSGIGGDIHIVILEKGFTTIRHYHRFEDFKELYEIMCEELAANKKN